MTKTRVTVIDDQANMGVILRKTLGLEGFDVYTFTSPREGIQDALDNGSRILITDLRMPEMTGEEVVARLREGGFSGQVIVMTAYGTIESATRCMRAGAYDYVTKPFDTKELIATVRRAAGGPARPVQESAPTPEGASRLERLLLGESEPIREVRVRILRFAPSPSPVLITGESGTGKEVVARALHEFSPRARARFVAINCATIPPSLMESELFGHEKGAFTGATDRRTGLIEAAVGGTLFLDEMGELPLELQAKLLRVLQEREITRVGAVENIPVDIRVIAATNRPLETEVAERRFREDLYYRLNVLKIRLPPLREREGDVRLLAAHFLTEAAHAAGRLDLRLSPQLLDELEKLPWNGNVRELQNVIERISILSDEAVVGPGILAEMSIMEGHPRPAPPDTLPTSSGVLEFREARDRFETQYLRKALHAAEGNVTEAARLTGMSRRNFYDKLEKLSINPADFKK